MIRLLAWVGAGTLVVLLARAIAYALEPAPSARILEHRAGGPALPIVILVSLALGASVAIAICWLAALGVRERALLERHRPSPHFPAVRTTVFALLLGAVTTLAGGLAEAYVHWRSGLGWHGLDCLTGPVHRDLIPLELGLSFVAAAVVAAAEHVVAWMRRTFALLRPVPVVERFAGLVDAALFEVPRRGVRGLPGAPRAPPVLSCLVPTK